MSAIFLSQLILSLLEDGFANGACHGSGAGHIFWDTLDTRQLDFGEQRALQEGQAQQQILFLKGNT